MRSFLKDQIASSEKAPTTLSPSYIGAKLQDQLQLSWSINSRPICASLKRDNGGSTTHSLRSQESTADWLQLQARSSCNSIWLGGHSRIADKLGLQRYSICPERLHQ